LNSAQFRHDICSALDGNVYRAENSPAQLNISAKLRYPFVPRGTIDLIMASKLSITYSTSRDLLGMASEEEYQRFKDELLEAFQQEWPDATVVIDDDEESSLDLDGITGQAEQDVRDRIEDIVTDIVETASWQDEEDDFFEEEDETKDLTEEDEN